MSETQSSSDHEVKPVWSQELRDGKYFQAIRVLRKKLNESNLLSYDPLAYALESVGCIQEASKLIARKMNLQAQNSVRVENEDPVRVLSPKEAVTVLQEAIRKFHIIIGTRLLN